MSWITGVRAGSSALYDCYCSVLECKKDFLTQSFSELNKSTDASVPITLQRLPPTPGNIIRGNPGVRRHANEQEITPIWIYFIIKDVNQIACDLSAKGSRLVDQAHCPAMKNHQHEAQNEEFFASSNKQRREHRLSEL